ncbi:MAG: tetratricopeptide repeat protein [Nannocystaceae bacterium]
MADVLRLRGQLDRARDQYQEALEIHEESFGSNHPDLVYPLLGLGRVAIRRYEDGGGRQATLVDTARRHAERILELGEVDPSLLAQARFLLAQALWPDRAERPRALALIQQAQEYWDTHPDAPARAAEVAWIESWLAEHRTR